MKRRTVLKGLAAAPIVALIPATVGAEPVVSEKTDGIDVSCVMVVGISPYDFEHAIHLAERVAGVESVTAQEDCKRGDLLLQVEPEELGKKVALALRAHKFPTIFLGMKLKR